ncbi:MAG: TonB-dependent receptor [Betaproteobacteria bacterium]|nr:TonB-dependent receptor [Betaproteobacteria bacterium]
MATNKSKWVVRALPMLIASIYAGGTMAQEQLEAIVVTAQKRQEKLQDVPISITAISGAQLEARGIEGIANLNAVAPNMAFRSNPGSDLISTVILRGSGTGQPAIWVDPAVGMYLDGVYIGKSQGSVFDVVDIERVEVLRGPQGTLFGRNTEGGAVNLVSRRPTGDWSGSVGGDR